MVKINFGAGWDCHDDWLNYDYSPTLFIERKLPLVRFFFKRNQKKFPDNLLYADIRSGLNLDDECVDLIYSSHVIEHLSYDDAILALRQIYRIMKKGATFRFVIPDLEYIINNYCLSSSSNRSDEFMKLSLLGVSSTPKTYLERLYSHFGNSRHLWMWDYSSISYELNKIGFSNIRRAIYNDSTNIEFNNIENFSRWKNSLGIECNK